MATAAERETVALHCWAVVHGLASLALDGHIDRDATKFQATIDAVLDVAVSGVAVRLA